MHRIKIDYFHPFHYVSGARDGYVLSRKCWCTHTSTYCTEIQSKTTDSAFVAAVTFLPSFLSYLWITFRINKRNVLVRGKNITRRLHFTRRAFVLTIVKAAMDAYIDLMHIRDTTRIPCMHNFWCIAPLRAHTARHLLPECWHYIFVPFLNAYCAVLLLMGL